MKRIVFALALISITAFAANDAPKAYQRGNSTPENYIGPSKSPTPTETDDIALSSGSAVAASEFIGAVCEAPVDEYGTEE